MDSVTSCYNRSLPIDWDSVKADPAGAKEILHIIFAINTTSLEMHLIRLDLQSALMYDSLMVFSYGVCFASYISRISALYFSCFASSYISRISADFHINISFPSSSELQSANFKPNLEIA